MAVALIIGPHQSGKTRRVWSLLHGAPLGAAVLVTPGGMLTREQVISWHAAFGAGPLPVTLSLEALFASLATAPTAPLTPRIAAHLVRRWCAEGALDNSVLAPIARFRATAADLADTCLRFDAHRLGSDEIDLARRTLGRTAPRLSRKLELVAQIGRRLVGSGLRSRGRSLADAADLAAASCPWPTVVIDDLISLSPAELQVLRSLAPHSTLVITAVSDVRLQRGSLLSGLRATFPEAVEEHLAGVHLQAGHAPAQRTMLAQVLTEQPLPSGSIDFYHYRDDAHAGRAIAAWLRRQALSPGQATLYLRVMGERGLAMADSLTAAGVPVRGSFAIPLGATASGGLVQALGAWCEEASWETFLSVCERLALALPEATAVGLPPRVAPTPVRHLRGSWAQLAAGAALERLAVLLVQPLCDSQEWQERDRSKPWLSATIGWLRDWLVVLTPVHGSWLANLQELCRRLSLSAVDEVLVDLNELQTHAPVGPTELRDQLALASVTVVRGADGDPGAALLIVDAVRGRSEARAVALVHGLEHGQWPASPRRGVCLNPDERRSLAFTLDGRDPWDEAGQASGEIAAFLAALARATRLAVLGIPCGERVPSPWLGGLCAQLGVDLVAERSRSAAEAVPGAPLGPSDSQGEHERALWGQAVRRPSFRFQLPERAPETLQVTASRLNDLLHDPFAFVLTTLRVMPALDAVQRRLDGQELHAVLSRLAGQPAAGWDARGRELVEEWIGLAADPLGAVMRRRHSQQVLAALAAEAVLVQDCQSEGERQLVIPIPHPDPGGGVLLTLRGTADRIDRWADGTQRIVDYKFATVPAYRHLLRSSHEGQLAAYAAALVSQGITVTSAHYRGLLDGDAAGYRGPSSPVQLGQDPPPIEQLGERLAAIGQAILAISAGTAATDPADGLCEARGFAPVARLDEARLENHVSETEEDA